MSGIYIHIPFCKKKCNYCDFLSFEKLYLIDNFLKALEIEFSIRKNEIKNLKTLYIGGGTPSILNIKQLEKLFNSIEKNFQKIDKFKESTIELNPESTNEEKIKLIKNYGFNRLSIGLQTTNDKFLKLSGRLSNFKEFIKVYNYARDNGFNNINLDIIFGFPGQTLKDLEKDLENLILLKPEHISTYCLEIHKDTPMAKMNLKQDEDILSKMYYEIINFLEKYSYNHYEISNFAYKGKESIHNLNYWNRGYYSGFGPGASSHINNIRFSNTDNIEKYIKNQISMPTSPVIADSGMEVAMEKLSKKDILNEKIILGLRKINGIELDKEIIIKFNNKIEMLIKKGFLIKEENRLKIKKEFLFISNYILTQIIN